MKRMSVKKLLGAGIKILIAAVVLAFLGLRSLDFFIFTTPADQWYLAWLGFGLTGGGLIAYLLILLWDVDTNLKKTVAIVMMVVCLVGELATAGFGMQVDAWKKIGFELADSDFQSMIFVIQMLGFAHAIALIAYVAGDKIAEAFGDEDGDGIPNYRDPDYKRKQQQQNQNHGNQQPARQFSAEERLAHLRNEVAKLEADAPKGQAGSQQNSQQHPR